MSRFCVAPWVNLEVSMLGSCRVCCHISVNAKTEDGKELHFGTDPVDDIWAAESIRDLRRQFIDGQEPKACNSCWTKEAHGGVSTRQNFNGWYKSQLGPISENMDDWKEFPAEGPRSFGMHPGNICSLKCRMCNPVKSSKIGADKVATEWADKSKIHHSRRIDLDTYRRTAWWKKDTFIEELVANMADGPKRLFIAGGEPFITPWVNSYLARLAKRPDANKIILQMYTNGQDLPPDMDVFAAFQQVILNVSLEAKGALNDYIRDLSKWADIERNMEVLSSLKNGVLIISPSLQIYNMLTLTDLVRWGVEKGLPTNIGHVDDPFYLDAVGAPLNLRAESARRLLGLAEELTALPGYKWNTTIRSLKTAAHRLLNPPATTNFAVRMQYFWQFTEEMDAARSQSLADVAPELVTALEAGGCSAQDVRPPVKVIDPPQIVKAGIWHRFQRGLFTAKAIGVARLRAISRT